MARRSSTSPWIYVGCGCLALVVLVTSLVVGGAYFGYSKIRGYAEDLEDPQRRNERALELLGAQRLPEGYFTLFFISVPWVLDFVMLTDSEAANQRLEAMDRGLEAGLFDGHTFFYLRASIVADPADDEYLGVRRRPMDDGRLRIEISDQQFISRQQLGEGVFVEGRQESRWTSHHGAFLDDSGRTFDGLFSVVEIFCGDKALRSAVWFLRDEGSGQLPADDTMAETASTAVEAPPQSEDSEDVPRTLGTPADSAALEELLNHFDFCAR